MKKFYNLGARFPYDHSLRCNIVDFCILIYRKNNLFRIKAFFSILAVTHWCALGFFKK